MDESSVKRYPALLEAPIACPACGAELASQFDLYLHLWNRECAGGWVRLNMQNGLFLCWCGRVMQARWADDEFDANKADCLRHIDRWWITAHLRQRAGVHAHFLDCLLRDLTE